MCTYRDKAMDRTGELPPDFRTAVEIEWSKGKTMDEGFSNPLENFSAAEVAPQGGAVRPLPSDLTEAERLDVLCQVEKYMNVTDKHSQTHPEAEAEEDRIYGLVNGLIAKRFSDIGAAVRGEAVAVSIADLHGLTRYEYMGRVPMEASGGKWLKASDVFRLFERQAVSARAADALDSQPTDLQAKLDRAERALLRAGFQDLGAQEWKPPIGKEPRWIEVPTAVPTGWKLMPKELPLAMFAIYEQHSIAPMGNISRFGYQAMWDAMPAPQQEGSEADNG